uniref:Nod3 protein n=1 Tax=Tetraselmis sp. GSL018 TaxID=582737 RepID=A0A061QPA1_9CHLO
MPSKEGLCSNLTSLNLENNCIDDAGALALAEMLQAQGPASRLTFLDLTSNEITAIGAKALSEALAPASSEGSDAGSDPSEEAPRRRTPNATLRVLNLAEGPKGAQALATALQEGGCRIEALDLADNGIRTEGAETLADVLLSRTSVTSLNLSGNSLGNTGAKALAELLKPEHALRRLALSRNGITLLGVKQLAHTFHTFQLYRKDSESTKQIHKTLILTGNNVPYNEGYNAFLGTKNLVVRL